MKINRILVFSALALLFACGDSTFPGFDKSENGLYYQIKPQNESGQKIAVGDIVTLDLTYFTDTIVLYDSKTLNFPTQLRVSEPVYEGDVMEGILMLNVGDSAIFKTSADSFYKNVANMNTRPEVIPDGAFLTFKLKVTNTQSYEELMAEKQAEAMTKMQEEQSLIETFIKENDITQEPTASGLYFIETAAGDGVPVERGSTVQVHYIGRLLTGEKFDASYDRDEPFSFTLGQGQVIPGWDEGIGYMTVGSKATLIIPSSLAYGDRPPPGSPIKAFSPLVFEVHLQAAN